MAQKPKKTNIKRLLNRGVDIKDVDESKYMDSVYKKYGLKLGKSLPVTVRDAKTGERKPEESSNMNIWNSAVADEIESGERVGLSKEQIIKRVKRTAKGANESLAEEKLRTFNKNKKKKKKQPQKKSD